MSMSRRSRASALLTKESWDPPTKQEVKKLLQGVAVASLGIGIGTSAGFAVDRLVLPKLMKHFGPTERKLISAGVGMAAGLAGSALSDRVFDRADKERLASGKGR